MSVQCHDDVVNCVFIYVRLLRQIDDILTRGSSFVINDTQMSLVAVPHRYVTTFAKYVLDPKNKSHHSLGPMMYYTNDRTLILASNNGWCSNCSGKHLVTAVICTASNDDVSLGVVVDRSLFEHAAISMFASNLLLLTKGIRDEGSVLSFLPDELLTKIIVDYLVQFVLAITKVRSITPSQTLAINYLASVVSPY